MKKKIYKIFRKKKRKIGTIGFSIYYISEKKINLLCHDLIGSETIYVYAITEKKIVEIINKYDFALNMKFQIHEAGDAECFFSIHKNYLTQILKLFEEQDAAYVNIIESNTQESILCQYCFSVSRYPMWRFIKEGNIISIMEIYFECSVSMNIEYYFDEMYQQPCLTSKYYEPKEII